MCHCTGLELGEEFLGIFRGRRRPRWSRYGEESSVLVMQAVDGALVELAGWCAWLTSRRRKVVEVDGIG